MTERIPLLDLAPELRLLEDELVAAFRRVLSAGRFILGPEVAAFEEEAAAYLGVRHAVGVNSGTDALLIGLRALGLSSGDEVITTPFTFAATAEAIVLAGGTPVFVDIDPASFNLDATLVEAAVTPRTRGVLPVHLFGRAADMAALGSVASRHGLFVLDDAAQAFGARLGGRRVGQGSHGAAFSFFPSKNLGGFGDGGLFVTDDAEAAALARALRAHGARVKYVNELLGVNSRLDEVQAALLRVKLPHVDGWNARRVAAAHLYDDALADVDGVERPAITEGHVFHQYTIRLPPERRDEVRARLSAAGVETAVYYPTPLHHFAPYRAGQRGPLPHAERAAAEVLSLPMGPFVDERTVSMVVQAIAGE